MDVQLEAGIVSRDGAALASFYEDGFAFAVESVRSFPQGDVWRLVRGEARLKIYQPAGGAADGPVAEPWHQYRGFAYSALHVHDAAGELERMTVSGATVLVELTEHRPGAQFALLADPEGNVWELLQESTGVE